METPKTVFIVLKQEPRRNGYGYDPQQPIEVALTEGAAIRLVSQLIEKDAGLEELKRPAYGIEEFPVYSPEEG